MTLSSLLEVLTHVAVITINIKKYIVQHVASEVLASYTCCTPFPRIELYLTENKRIPSPDDGWDPAVLCKGGRGE